MQISSHSKITQTFNDTSLQNQQIYSEQNNFEKQLLINKEKSHSSNLNKQHCSTIKNSEDRSIEIVRNSKNKEIKCMKEKDYLSKKQEEHKRRIKIMMQVLNDISKFFPYMAYYLPIKIRSL